MICPQCRASNPDGVSSCGRCAAPLDDKETTLRLDAGRQSAFPTMEGSATLQAPGGAGGSAGGVVSRALPEGMDIGRRYRVKSLLGVGGMGSVYRVYDRELECDVALKLIRSEIAENPAALERFKREIQLSHRVTHRNVLRVYDLGESDGIRFLTMEFVDGENLAALLAREGKLAVEKLIAIFRQIAEGLKAAHEHGVIHRDLKPQNIMLDREGNVFLTDFGLAKSLEQAGVTQTGMIVGTPYYMSPEQVKGVPIDHRSDIYSLGVILYEMATGTVPYTGSSPYEVMIQRVQRPPRPAGELNPRLPAYLRRILQRCMEMDPAVRYGSVAELLDDLNAATFRRTLRYEVGRRRWLRPLSLGVLGALLLLGGGLWMSRPRPAAAPPSTASRAAPALPVLGVASFVNRTGDSTLDWYGEGIARLVADSLAQSPYLRVVSADRTFTLTARTANHAALQRAASNAGIEFLLTGDILPGARGLTVSTRLSNTRTGHEVAAGRVDALTAKTLIGAADRIALVARKGMGVPPIERVDAYGADFLSRNPEAYESYVTGLRAVNEYRYPQAEKAFQDALEKAPDYAMARYWLATVKAASGRTGEALADIERVVAQASSLPDREARYASAAQAYFSRRYDDAVRMYRELIAKYPYEIEARRILAFVLLDSNRPKDAAVEAQALGRIAPESHVVWSILGTAHLAMKDFNQAVLDFKKYVELEPRSANGHHLLADAYRSQGELDLAAQEYGKALAADASFRYSAVELAKVDVLRGRRREAEARLTGIVSDAGSLPVHRIDAAFALAAIARAEGRFDDSSRVLATLEKPISEEKVRAAQALSERGIAFAELGRHAEARRLIGLAIERSPGVPTRYLFSRGVQELREGRLAAVRKTAAKILEGSLPPGDPDRTEEKAAAYLRGRVLLSEGKADAAIEELSRAVSLSGYEYGIYRMGLAEAYLAAGKLQEALSAALQAAGPLDPVNPRLDLELDRTRALLVVAEVQKAMGRKAEVARLAREFQQLWARADPGLPDLARARRLASDGRAG